MFRPQMKMAYKQRTVKKPVHFSGVGVHSGETVNLTITPAPPNYGIHFKRVDLPAQPAIKAHFNRVVDTSLATVIGDHGCIVSTIEHLMACLAGLAIDNAVIEIDGHETPIMDGSAALFTRKIREAGITYQEAPRLYFAIKEPIILEKDGKSVSLFPDRCFKITCTIDFNHPAIGQQTFSIEVTEQSFEEEIARARTFGFLHEVEYLKFYGLAKGGSLENAVVINENGIMNADGLRFSDEFVRHKILDCIGDFSLLGMPIIGHAVLYKSGHLFNHEFLKEFFKQKSAWETMTLDAFLAQQPVKPEAYAESE